MTILYILIAVIVGWFIGFLDSNLRTAKKIEAAEANAELKIEEAETRIAQAEQKFATPPNLKDDPGLLRLKKNEGRYTLEMDGVPVTAELSHDKRKRLVELLTVFRLWLEAGQFSSAASQPAAPTPTSPVLDPAQREVPRPVQSSPKPVSPSKKANAEKNISSLSIVQQIDTVLQANLADTPLAKRGVRLQESIQGGVEVYVGLQKFLEVDDVPDEIIKAAIRAAIAEWEKKFTPGF
jgi:hypothetical protein